MGYSITSMSKNSGLVVKQTSIDKGILSIALPFKVKSNDYSEFSKLVERSIGKINSNGYGISITNGANARLSSRMTDSGDAVIHISIQMNLNRYINSRKGIPNKIVEYRFSDGEIDEGIRDLSCAIICTVDHIVEVLNSALKKVSNEEVPKGFEAIYQIVYFESNCDLVIQAGSDKDISNIGLSIKRTYPKSIYSIGNIKHKDVVLGVRSEVGEGHSIGGYVKDPSILRLEDRRSKRALVSFNSTQREKTLAEKLILLKNDGSQYIQEIFDNHNDEYQIEALEAREIIRSHISENAYNQIIRILFTFNGSIRVTYKDDLLYRNVLKLRKVGILIKVCRSEYRLKTIFHRALCRHYHTIRSFKPC